MTLQAVDTPTKSRNFPMDDRYDKGSAMSVIESERKQTNEKTSRLRAMRLEREASAVVEVKAPKKVAVRKRAAKAVAVE